MDAPALNDILYLLTIPNIGPARIRKLFLAFESVDQLLKAPVQNLTRIEGIDLKLAENIKKGGDAKCVQQQLAQIKKE